MKEPTKVYLVIKELEDRTLEGSVGIYLKESDAIQFASKTKKARIYVFCNGGLYKMNIRRALRSKI